MRICVAQTRPIKGNIQGNIDNHITLINLAISVGANVVVFPELSLTGYEPTLAEALAIHQDDSRLDNFQVISNAQKMIIGIGVPTRNHTGICISMVLFQPHQARQTYSKKYLHSDEEAFFTSGKSFPTLSINKANVAFAICYELSVPEHAEKASTSGADIYIASVAKSAKGVEQAAGRLSEVAQKYSMTVFMSNCIGPCDDFESGGKTSVWNHHGVLLKQLDDIHEGIIIYDTETQALFEKTRPHIPHQILPTGN